MADESACLKIPKEQGQNAITLAYRLRIVNKGLHIQRDEHFVYIPIFTRPSEDVLETLRTQVSDFEVVSRLFREKREKKKAIMDVLEDKLPPHLLASLPHSMDIVGDIAIVEVSPELDPYKHLVGQAVLNTNSNVRTVLAKAGAIGGEYRIRAFNAIAGMNRTETVHKEYGCQFHVDVSKAYFSPRLSYEHNRVASLVDEGETVVDLFAGVGPFAVQIAKRRESVIVYAVDVNPAAIELLKRNIRLNRVESKVYPILGDAREVVMKKLMNVANRVIMNLPERAVEYLDVACRALKATGGVVHFYGFVDKTFARDDLQSLLETRVKKHGRKVESIVNSKLVRATAPFEWQAVIDAKIS